MGDKGHKGAIGLPGGVNIGDFEVIIQFRNKKYNIDISSAESMGKTYDDIDKEYDDIDHAINNLIKQLCQ